MFEFKCSKVLTTRNSTDIWNFCERIAKEGTDLAMAVHGNVTRVYVS